MRCFCRYEPCYCFSHVFKASYSLAIPTTVHDSKLDALKEPLPLCGVMARTPMHSPEAVKFRASGNAIQMSAMLLQWVLSILLMTVKRLETSLMPY